MLRTLQPAPTPVCLCKSVFWLKTSQSLTGMTPCFGKGMINDLDLKFTNLLTWLLCRFFWSHNWHCFCILLGLELQLLLIAWLSEGGGACWRHETWVFQGGSEMLGEHNVCFSTRWVAVMSVGSVWVTLLAVRLYDNTFLVFLSVKIQ